MLLANKMNHPSHRDSIIDSISKQKNLYPWTLKDSLLQELASFILNRLTDCLLTEEKISTPLEMSHISLKNFSILTRTRGKTEITTCDGDVILTNQQNYPFCVRAVYAMEEKKFGGYVRIPTPKWTHEQWVAYWKKDKEKFYSSLGLYPIYHPIDQQWIFSGTRDGLKRLATRILNTGLDPESEQDDDPFRVYIVDYHCALGQSLMLIIDNDDGEDSFINFDTIQLTRNTFIHLGSHILSRLLMCQPNDQFIVTEFIEHTHHSL